MLTSALSWAITAWCGNKNKCQKVLRIPCGTECPVPYRVFHIIMWSIQFLIGTEYVSGMAFPIFLLASVSFWMCRLPCIGRSQTSLHGQMKHTCARGLMPGWYLLCNFSEHVQQDNITYTVNLICQTCFACMIYLSGIILDISLQNLAVYTVVYHSFSDMLGSSV